MFIVITLRFFYNKPNIVRITETVLVITCKHNTSNDPLFSPNQVYLIVRKGNYLSKKKGKWSVNMKTVHTYNAMCMWGKYIMGKPVIHLRSYMKNIKRKHKKC